MTRLFCFLVIFVLFSCGDRNKTQADSNNSENAVQQPTSDSQVSEVEQAALSFYKWYLKAIIDNKTPFDVTIVEGKDGMCRMDFEPYFNELRKLGTISEKFMESERLRNSICEDYIKTIHYKSYEQADAYAFDNFCPEFSYMYWISSQEPYQDAKAVRTIIDKDGMSANVDVSFIYIADNEDPIVPKTPNARVFLEKEDGKWKITKILFLEENGKIRNYQRTVNDDETIFKSWTNGIIDINISEKNITIQYHGQCVYFYPVQVVSKKEVILLWSNDMDCKFDNGTSETFGLEKHPEMGKPFAKYTLEGNMLYTEYFYKEWIEKYGKEVNDKVFTDLYFYKTSDSN